MGFSCFEVRSPHQIRLLLLLRIVAEPGSRQRSRTQSADGLNPEIFPSGQDDTCYIQNYVGASVRIVFYFRGPWYRLYI